MSKTKAKEIADRRVAVSQEYVDDSSGESESESSSAEESTQKTSKKSSLKNHAESESSSESDSASTSQSSLQSSGSSESAGSKRSPDRPIPIKEPLRKKQKTHATEPQRLKGHSFNPPAGYDKIKLDAADFVSETGGMFSDLDGTQVWHITAPASVPITSIEEFDIAAALRGEPILYHKGVSYNMFATSSKGETMLLPKGTESTYSKATVEISRNFHLREVTQDRAITNGTPSSRPTTNTGTQDDEPEVHNQHFFASKEGMKKPHREQPSGLVMRYQPYGSATKKSVTPYRLPNPEADEDEDDNVPENTLQVPSALSDDDSRGQVTPKKTKSSKHSRSGKPSNENEGSRGDAMEIDLRLNGGATTGTPRSKTKTGGAVPSSEKKRKKERKEKSL